jgi:hypothetical protein
VSRHAEDLTWERARAGKTDLLMLVKIADLADDDGRNAWPEVPRLMKYCRMSERGVEYTLQRLEQQGELLIEHNDAGREIVLRGGRTFRPKWFLHVRCVCEWEAYQRGEKPATLAGLGRAGRPRRKPATLAGSRAIKTRKVCLRNPQRLPAKPASSALGGYIGIDPAVDPAVEPDPPAPRSANGGRVRILRQDRREAERLLTLNFGRCWHEPPHTTNMADCRAEIAATLAEHRRDAEARATAPRSD